MVFRALAVISIVQPKVFPYLGQRVDSFFSVLDARGNFCGEIVVFYLLKALLYELMDMEFLALPRFAGKLFQLLFISVRKAN